MNKWIKMAQEVIELLKLQIELQQTTNRLLAAQVEQQNIANKPFMR